MATLSETPGAGPSTTPSSTNANSHLSYYTPETERSVNPPVSNDPAPARELSKNRLYVGNLHPSVDEYTFVQLFKKFGTISKFDFLFHKSGPSKGKPRGYAFVEYKDKEDALKALVNAHDKIVHGRKLVVTYANQAPVYDTPFFSGSGKHRRTEVQRPTALSLIKSSTRPVKTKDRIAALEAKLRQMEQHSSTTVSSLPSHPSLPLKPPPSSVPTTSSLDSAKPSPSRSSNQAAKRTPAKMGGIFASGSSASLGKKPTLEELMKSKKKATVQDGLLKR
ncbi:hypothetical protein ACEPAG_9154 [Sanghuangporus baumii]